MGAVGWLVVFPVVLIAAAGIAAFVSVRLSSVCITRGGVEFRNYPHPVTTIPLDDIDRFVETERVGWLSGVQPATAALVLNDGTRVPVRSIRECSGAYGVDAMNARLGEVRAGPR
jgi:hypothetical protein